MNMNMLTHGNEYRVDTKYTNANDAVASFDHEYFNDWYQALDYASDECECQNTLSVTIYKNSRRVCTLDGVWI